MPGWKDLFDETQAYATEAGSAFDVVRRKYLRRYAQLVGRNVIVCYSGWLQKPELEKQGVPFDLNDADKNAFVAVIHRMEKRKGVDLFLHSPGGDLAATESIVDYVRRPAAPTCAPWCRSWCWRPGRCWRWRARKW